MIGELVGARYRVINVLGSGGFGHTYIAEDTQRPGNPRCVLKHLTFNSHDPAVLQQVRRLFRSEAETLEQLGRHDQIPRLLAYFEENQQFYLVQEYIEGHPLSEELTKGTQLTEAEVIPLLEDVLSILEFVHAQGVVHRDIKPANLIRRRQDSRLVLIDFGAVKLIGNTIAEATGETSLSLPVYTSGYASSEQCLGRPRFCSDIYSLGMVGIQSLTGLHPSQLPHDYGTSEVIWRNQAAVSDELAMVLDKMTRYHFNDRYPSASDALQAVRQVISTAPTLLTNKPVGTDSGEITRLPDRTAVSRLGSLSQMGRLDFPGKRTLTRIGLAVLGTLTVAVLLRSFSESGFQSVVPVPTPTAPAPTLTSDRISAGEKPLLKWQILPKKQEGIDQIAAQDYAKAIPLLEAARQVDRSDPELLIYLNNARIGADKSHDLAVVVPLSSGSLPSALELLRGVAQAQEQINRDGGINGVPVKVLIADDSNQAEAAEQIAKTLADSPSVLGVVGHGTSDTSLIAAQIYQDRSLVMVAPVSSAVQLGQVGDYIFRTMPSDKQTANALKDYLLTRINKRRVAVFHNSGSRYSQSLKEEFENALGYSGVKDVRVVSEIDVSRPDFDPEESLNQAIAQKAEVLMLAADSGVMERAVRVVEVNDRKLPILGGDSLFNPNLLRFGKTSAVGIVLAVPVNLTGSPFLQQGKALWGQPDRLSWRTALAYDATQALIAAIAADPNRNGIRRTLAQPTFETKGANGMVNFREEGDRNKEPVYVTIAPVTSGKTKRYQFIPLPLQVKK